MVTKCEMTLKVNDQGIRIEIMHEQCMAYQMTITAKTLTDVSFISSENVCSILKTVILKIKVKQLLIAKISQYCDLYFLINNLYTKLMV